MRMCNGGYMELTCRAGVSLLRISPLPNERDPGPDWIPAGHRTQLGTLDVASRSG